MKLQKKPQQQVSIEQQRSGFTIVELLVVIAIIGVLMALLLPAVQSARESGRKTACMSNAYQLGMAVNRFDQDKGKVPGWSQPLSSNVVGWPVMSLPYIERNDLYAEWATGNVSGGLVNVFICPSAQPNAGNDSPLSYVGNCGNQGDATPSLYCGVMANNYSTSYSLEDVSDGDGTATTLLFGEKAMGPGYDIQKRWRVFQYNGANTSLPSNNSMNFSNTTNNILVGAIIDGYPAFGLPTTAPGQNLRSAHTGGSVVAFCDGHTYFLGNDVTTNVYMQLVTSNSSRIPDIGSGVPSPYRPKNIDNSFYILNESDF